MTMQETGPPRCERQRPETMRTGLCVAVYVMAAESVWRLGNFRAGE